jgi:hypothetical protein
MKFLYKTCIIAACIIFCLASCDTMNDMHIGYLEKGEKIYAAKVDSVSPKSGDNNSIEMEVFIRTQRVDRIRIYWNVRRDSADFNIGNVAGVFKFRIENLQEREYLFEVISFDRFGNKSLPFEVSGRIYGESYRSLLQNRSILSIFTLEGGSTTVNWGSVPENSLYSELAYTDSDGNKQILRIPPAETSTPLTNWRSIEGSRTAYLPDVNAVDTFYTDWGVVDNSLYLYKFSKEGWTVISWSDEQADDGGGAVVLINNNLNDFWHSQWRAPAAQLPHWAIIDMGVPKKIAEINTYRRKSNTNTKSVWYYVGDDPDPEAASWTKIAEGTFASGDLLTLQTSVSVAGRYLKIYLPDSNNGQNTSVAEIDVFGHE